jgi:hypothetical protein
MMKFLTGILVISIMVCSGCSKPPPVPEEPAPEPTVFDYTDKSKTVTAEEIRVQRSNISDGGQIDSQKLSVNADFNLDGKKDLALVEETADGQTEVAVYIQKEDGEENTVYFKGGSIAAPVDGAIIGIMSRRGQKHTDLVLLVSKPGESNELIQYRNTGSAFNKESDEEETSGIQPSNKE